MLANKTSWLTICAVLQGEKKKQNTPPDGFSNSGAGAGNLTTYLLGSAHPERTQPDGWPLTSPLRRATGWAATWVSSVRGDASLPPGSRPADFRVFLFHITVRNPTLPRAGDPQVTRELNGSVSYRDSQPWNRSLGGKGK